MVETSLGQNRRFKFELVAPEKVELSGHEERVLLPGEEGDFVVLPGHQLLLAALRPGVVSVMRANSTVDYFIYGGMADVGNEHCIVLTPASIPVAKLDAAELDQGIERYEADIAAAIEAGEETEAFQRELTILKLKRAALGKAGSE